MPVWKSLVSTPEALTKEASELLDSLAEFLPIPEEGTPLTRLLAWINIGIKEGILTEKEGHQLKLTLGRAV